MRQRHVVLLDAAQGITSGELPFIAAFDGLRREVDRARLRSAQAIPTPPRPQARWSGAAS